jgi:hypothetical protein
MQDIPPKGGGTPVPPEFYENLDNLCALLRKQIALYGELKRSCRVADLLGIPPKELTGKIGTGIYAPGGSAFKRQWNTEELVIRRDGEEVFRAKLIDVHQDLWPDDVRAEYARHVKRNSRIMSDT